MDSPDLRIVSSNLEFLEKSNSLLADQLGTWVRSDRFVVFFDIKATEKKKFG
jgi:hypothetical protein